jgi:hypothetical protein
MSETRFRIHNQTEFTKPRSTYLLGGQPEKEIEVHEEVRNLRKR